MATTPDPRYEYQDAKIEALLQKLGMLINEAIKQTDHEHKLGFALFIFGFDTEEFFWLCNAERESMQRALREFLAREGGH